MPTSDRWYGEITARLQAVETEVRNLRDWRRDLDHTLTPLFHSVQGLKDAVDKVPDAVKQAVDKVPDVVKQVITTTTTISPTGPGTGENRVLQMRDVYVYLGGLGTFYLLAKILHWF